MRLLLVTRTRAIGVEDGRIVAPEGRFDLTLDLGDAELRPGLINAHEHLHRNHYGRLGRPPYASARAWARDISVHERARIARGQARPRREALLVGAWKNLFAGVTSVMHHDRWEAALERGFPLRVARVASADSLGMTAKIIRPASGPFALHVAEGVDADAQGEVAALDDRRLLDARLIAVHAVDPGEDGIARLRRSGAAVTWCPSSNLFLFGRSAPPALLAPGIDVLLGSDSLLTAAGDLLDELRLARRLGLLSDVRLETAVGETAARRLGLPAPSLEPGAPADLVAIARPLLDASAHDVLLTLVGGTPRVAIPPLADRFEGRFGEGRLLRVGTVERWTPARFHSALPPNAPDGRGAVPDPKPEVPMSKTRSSLYVLPALAGLMLGSPAQAQDAATPAPAPAESTPVQSSDTAALPETPAADAADQSGGGTDILSAHTLSILLDGRIVAADGHRSWSTGDGLSKSRFSGAADGGMKVAAVPVEADLIWQPRFTNTLTGNVSGGWQRDQENPVDMYEAFLTWLPERKGNFGVSLKGGLYWPEISLEHATGGAWSTVYTITPSAINSWVGEEVKVLGGEATLYATIGQQQFSLTGGLFGFNDTSGTLLSFRGWSLSDAKATAFGHFPLPPLNTFMQRAQEDQTRSALEIDHRIGWYGRFEWKASEPVSVNFFYYDNRGNPQAVNQNLQWGWRTRFANLGMTADIGPNTRLLMQGMIGTTQMGFNTNGVVWVNTKYRSAYALVSQTVSTGAISGRVEVFDTRERGSQMSPRESEDGWAVTLAGRMPITNWLTGFVEGMHIRSDRGQRTDLGIPATENQNVLQISLRARI
jgi:cytosine/adenosine deaminase-related metal-dependent hydrolase